MKDLSARAEKVSREKTAKVVSYFFVYVLMNHWLPSLGKYGSFTVRLRNKNSP